MDFDEFNSKRPSHAVCLLRHDVDYMPEWSTNLGEIERARDIRATYFFQVGAETYNLRDSRNVKAVRALHEMGHVVGLHFDIEWSDESTLAETASRSVKEKALFEAITGVAARDIVSFHNPHRFQDRILDQTIPGLRHTYERCYFSQIKYLSDSQGWQEDCMCRVFAGSRYQAIQLLTHPYI